MYQKAAAITQDETMVPQAVEQQESSEQELDSEVIGMIKHKKTSPYLTYKNGKKQ